MAHINSYAPLIEHLGGSIVIPHAPVYNKPGLSHNFFGFYSIARKPLGNIHQVKTFGVFLFLKEALNNG